MSILAASHQDTVLNAALAYLEAGISVIPVRGKQAAVSWSRFQTERAPFSFAHNWNRAGLLSGVGVVCGAVSGNLVVMDLDGLEAVNTFEFCFPDLLDTHTVISGSGKGKHLYYFTDEPTQTTRTNGYELRSDGCYVVAPPSVHPTSGREYLANWTDVKRVPNLNAVRQWITDMIREKQPSKQPTIEPSMSIRDVSAYGRGALDAAARNLAAAADRNRNNTLYREALKLGSLVRDGVLTMNDVEIVLMRQCESIGLVDDDGERQCLATIKSGLRNGINSSRQDWKKR